MKQLVKQNWELILRSLFLGVCLIDLTIGTIFIKLGLTPDTKESFIPIIKNFSVITYYYIY